jgi:hypothetical protein
VLFDAVATVVAVGTRLDSSLHATMAEALPKTIAAARASRKTDLLRLRSGAKAGATRCALEARPLTYVPFTIAICQMQLQ